MEDFETELKRDFLSESKDLLANAEGAFLRLESERTNPELLNEIFRLAHNLKGTSKAVGFDQLASLTHTAENLILKLKDSSIQVNDQVVSILLEFKDKVYEMVEGLSSDLNAQFEITTIQNKINIMIEKKGVVEEVVTSPIVDAPSAEDSRFEEINPAALESLKELGLADEATISQLQSQVHVKPDIIEEFQNKVDGLEIKNEDKIIKKPSEKSLAKDDEDIRVKLSRIDKLNNIIGELVILNTVLGQRRYQNIQDELSNKTIGQMSKLFKEVQELSMSLRMVPLKTTFQKMLRIVRDTSKALSKDVKLVLIGEDTEVDKTVLEKLSDPLVHIIRNAVDHGLESSEERRKVGKNVEGEVYLKAYHEGNHLVLEITDDGKGINPEIIKKKAIEKKLISDKANMSDSEIINLIFHPGFSTKEQVTEVSGRGVGMDVVKTNIEQLGGEVQVTSITGKGSKFKLVLEHNKQYKKVA